MKIKTTGPLKQGRASLKARTVYNVPDLYAGHFIGNGWAVEAPADAKAIDVDPTLFAAAPPKAVAGEAVVQPDDVTLTTSTKILGQ